MVPRLLTLLSGYHSAWCSVSRAGTFSDGEDLGGLRRREDETGYEIESGGAMGLKGVREKEEKGCRTKLR